MSYTSIIFYHVGNPSDTHYIIIFLGYPLVNKQFAIENGPVEVVDLPINSKVIFHSYVAVCQGLNHIK